MKTRKLKILLIAGLVLHLLYFNYYALHVKGSANQSGSDIKSEAIFYLVLGLFIFLVSKIKMRFKGKTEKLTLIIISFLLLTSVNFYLFDYFNIIVEYNTWLGRGQPSKPFWF